MTCQTKAEDGGMSADRNWTGEVRVRREESREREGSTDCRKL